MLVSQCFSSCLPQRPVVAFPLVFHLSHSRFPYVSQLSLSCLPVVFRLFPSCSQSRLPDVNQMPGCCLPVASKVSPLVGQLSSACLPDGVSSCLPDVFPYCLPIVSQMWSPNCLSELFSAIPSFPPELVLKLSPSVFHLSPSCLSNVVSHSSVT